MTTGSDPVEWRAAKTRQAAALNLANAAHARRCKRQSDIRAAMAANLIATWLQCCKNQSQLE
jgi:hypothetical protein